MISMDRQYRTRDGLEVRIYAVDGSQDYPIHGAVNHLSGWEGYEWTTDGRISLRGTDDCDLIEIPREITVKLFLNVDKDGHWAAWHDHDFAKNHREGYSIIAFPVTITIPENWKAEK